MYIKKKKKKKQTLRLLIFFSRFLFFIRFSFPTFSRKLNGEWMEIMIEKSKKGTYQLLRSEDPLGSVSWGLEIGHGDS